jgi:predicted short-subunit dehydrogenase-like oxidoreductase (DUF2520 family)
MEISLVGSGNVATHLAVALKREGFHIHEIASTNIDHARELAEKVKADAVEQVSMLNPMVDLIIVAVSDSAIPQVARELPATSAAVVHTAGSIGMDIFNRFTNHGVLYPFQTFSKQKEVDFSHLPILIEAKNTLVCDILNHVALQLSNKVTYATSAQRKQLHLAAVFACNFVNNMYAVSYQLMEQCELPFEILLPLIEETVNKVKTMAPLAAQTGPAQRNDHQVMEMHMEALESPRLREIYKLLSQNIIEMKKEASSF